MKYIIKNCPSLNRARNLCNEIICTCYADCNMGKPVVNCQYCTDCLLKQIVKKCRFWINFCKECRETDILCEDCTYSGKADFAKEILSMLEIEECEE